MSAGAGAAVVDDAGEDAFRPLVQGDLVVNPAEKVVDAGNVDREDVYTSNATPFLPIVTDRVLGRTTSCHQGSGPSGMMA